MKKEEKLAAINTKKIKKYAEFFKKYFLKYFLISLGSIIVLILIILWAVGTISISGDGYCTSKECNSGSKDCNPEKCINQICQPQVGENCSNSVDCGCGTSEVCDLNRVGTSNIGCYPFACGDGFCDAKGESKNSCCKDCGCEQGYSCNKLKNECQFLAPELDINLNYVVEGVSASTLYSNRELVDNSGQKYPFVYLKIINNQANVAKNIILSVKIDKYTNEQKDELDKLKPGESKNYGWYPTPTEEMLNILDDASVLVNINITFEDEHGNKYTSTKSIPVTIVGRSNWGTLSSVSQYVTPIESVVRQAVSAAGSFSTMDDDGISEGAKKIWNLLKGLNIDYISDPTVEYRQYPAEVLSRKKGDCDDLATLYVALLESVGIKTALITHPGHMYAAFYDSKYIYPIETTMLTSSYEDALNAGLEEYNSHDNNREITVIEDEWAQKNIKPPGNVGIKASDLAFPNILVHTTYDSEWKCTNQDQYSCYHYDLAVYCNLTFVNTGTESGQSCVDTTTYVDDYVVQTKTTCVTVDAGNTKTKKITYTDPNHVNAAYTYKCETK